MELLREKSLIFGSLYTVNEPHMVERYNRALEGFGLPHTKLKEFQIDMTGFSPEIAGSGRQQPPVHHPDAQPGRTAGGAYVLFQYRRPDG